MSDIHIVQTCPVCHGTGEQYNQDWQEYMRAFRHSGFSSYAVNDVYQLDYFMCRGYSEIPDIIETCRCCDGDGRVVGTMSRGDYYELLCLVTNKEKNGVACTE